MKKRITLVFLAVSIFLLSFGCKKKNTDTTNPENPPSNEVWMQNSQFNPKTITVAVNTTIIWTNKDEITHTVTSDNGLFDSGNMNKGGTYSHTFTTTGTFPYNCIFHSSMVGTVIVQ